MATTVPPFFHSVSESSGCYSGVFNHNASLAQGEAHIRWWPSERPLQTVIIFVPGNPGLIDFYVPFLSALHERFQDNGLAILAHAHLGHTPHLNNNINVSAGLLHQVDAVVETLDAVKSCWPDVKVVLIGHSIGSWVSTQVLKARPQTVDGVFLLFPTISHLSQTPNGKKLAWLFNAHMVSIIGLLSIVIRPVAALMLALVFSTWPAHQKSVLRSLVCSRQSIHACLTMAREEMHTLKEPDVPLLKQYLSKLWFYYASKDDWVGSERENVLRSLGLEGPAVQVLHCRHSVPHAFCILHGDIIAAQCATWLSEGGFIKTK